MSCCQARPVNLRDKPEPVFIPTLPVEKESKVIKQNFTCSDFVKTSQLRSIGK